MKILIVNLHSSSNAGDDVLTRVTVDLLRQHFPNASLTLAMNDPASYKAFGNAVPSFMTWIKPFDRISWHTIASPLAIFGSVFCAFSYRFWGRAPLWLLSSKHRHLLDAYFDADFIVSSAGNFLYSSGRLGIAFLLAIYTLIYGRIIGKPVYMMPQTIGPIKHDWERYLLRLTIPKLRLVFVRDPISMDLLHSLHVWHSGCYLVPDVAFLFSGDDNSEGLALLNRQNIRNDDGRPFLGVTLINWQAQNREFRNQEGYETAVSTAIRAFVTELNGRAILFSQVRGPTQADDDRIPARRVYEKVKDLSAYVSIIEDDMPPSTLKAAYGLMDIFIGTRLHSNIFALTAGTPAVMIQYQYKTKGIVQMLGLDEWVLDINDINGEILTTKLRALWQNRLEVTAQINESITSMSSKVAQVGLLIAEDVKAIYS